MRSIKILNYNCNNSECHNLCNSVGLNQKNKSVKMSETVQSEVVKSVSEAGEFECQQNPTKYSPGDGRGMVYENSSKKHQNGISNAHTISNGNSPGGETTGSRTGSQFLPSLLNATLPSKIAIIVGLCQVAVGGAMVLTGILAIRYQSYLFHYGTGLWAGLVSAIAGMLAVMCTKRGVPKPTWMGGKKWQVHVFLLSVVFSLSSVILLAIFSISGLLQDAKTIMAVERDYLNDVDDFVEYRNSSGILINTILLLLSVLQILLCFSSLGIAVRVMFKTKGNLLSSKGSSGSEIAIRDGQEYHARKDHLIHWLGNQRPNIIPLGFGGGSPQKPNQKYPPPSFVAIQPVMYPAPRAQLIPYPIMHQRAMIPIMQPHPGFAPQFFGPHPGPPTHLVPLYRTTPTPSGVMMAPRSRRAGSATPVSSIASLSVAQDHHNRRQRRRAHGPRGLLPPGVIGSSIKSYQTHSLISSKAPSVISLAKTESEKNNEVEVTEVDVSQTYTGLDRSIADEYISAMNARKISNGSVPVSSAVSGGDDMDEDSEAEITRM